MAEKKEEMLLDSEMEFLASKRETKNKWELFKENMRHLKRECNISLLNQSLKSHHSSLLHTQSIHEFGGDWAM
ncbi:hypothetical protein ACH5RR_035370 [Cinchona calisaya]|uniref:Uncharacterized protein n=1 Tax=Cinchona calisaya TaxID=153742 RepID=A0ABD2YDN5_9GENT